jgi:hypothetical protein
MGGSYCITNYLLIDLYPGREIIVPESILNRINIRVTIGVLAEEQSVEQPATARNAVKGTICVSGIWY